MVLRNTPSKNNLKTQESKIEGAENAPQEIKAPVKNVIVVASGKSITSKKGILKEGQEVKAKYFQGGQKTIDDLLEKGFLLKA